MQGGLFCLLAVLVVAALPWLAALSQQTLVVGMAVAVFLLGVPHGALDSEFAKALYSVRSLAQWICFVVAYVLLAALVVLTWSLAPGFFLASFLAISAYHFSGDPDIALPPGVRFLYGAAIVVLPTLLHSTAVATLFAYLAGPSAAFSIAGFLESIALPVLVGNALLIALTAQTNRLAALEIMCVVLLSIAAPPLIAFTVFFCAMHSPRHLMRTASFTNTSLATLLRRVAVLPMLACLIAGAIALLVFSGAPLEARVTRIVFLGLAALTVPHMLLVEQVTKNTMTRNERTAR